LLAPFKASLAKLDACEGVREEAESLAKVG
jgi:hypothetical protein